MASKAANKVFNATRSKPINAPTETQLGSPGYDNVRDDIEKTKSLREGSVEKVPVFDSDIVNKKYVDDKNIESFPTTFTDGSVVFADSLKLAQDNSNIFWDNVNKRLGIGTASPDSSLHVETGQILAPVGSTPVPSYSFHDDPDTGIRQSGPDAISFIVGGSPGLFVNAAGFRFGSGRKFEDITTGNEWVQFVNTDAIGNDPNVNFFEIRNGASTVAPILSSLGTDTNIDLILSPKGTGGVGINTTSPDTKLQVVGDLKVGDDNTNYMEVGTTGDMVFVGTAGLAYGMISATDNTTESAIATAGTPVQVLIFDTDGPNNNTTPDHTNDHITVTKAGDYKLMCSVTLNSVVGAGSRVQLTAQKNNGASVLPGIHSDRNVGGGAVESGAMTMSGIVTLAANDTVEIWIENETNTQNYVIEDISLSLIQIGG